MSSDWPDEGGEGFMAGVRVLELADERGEYCGKLLAGLGADVIKVEPPQGEATRRYGPYYHDRPHLDRSLYFWHYNFGKRGVTLDLDETADQDKFRHLAAGADVIVETRPRHFLRDRGLDADTLRADRPELVYCRLTSFGDDGPWAEFEGSDLVHLALGGVMMNCGYDPDGAGDYGQPPMAPQMWQSYQIAGEQAGMAVIAALNYRLVSGRGQYLSTSIHEAVSKCTETDLPHWMVLGQVNRRQTCRHSMPHRTEPILAPTQEGRWIMPYSTYLDPGTTRYDGVLRLLEAHGRSEELDVLRQVDPTSIDGAKAVAWAERRLIASLPFDQDIWREAQAQHLAWAPMRRPEENLEDSHFTHRETFFDVHHPELDETFAYVGAKWLAPGISWRRGPRAPLLGEHNSSVFTEGPTTVTNAAPAPAGTGTRPSPFTGLSRRQAPFALDGVRIIDLSWFLASAGAGRFFTSLGAQVIKVEHESRWDMMRWGAGLVPPAGRSARRDADGPLPTPERGGDPNRSASFMDINAGKLGVSLNLKHPDGKQLLAELIASSDMVIEGFSPGTMDRMGFGYAELIKLNPRLIYVQQTGFGQRGEYHGARAFGPTAAAFSGISEMSGLPSPFPPAGIGYSYLDWFGAYNMATAMMAALFRQRRTGAGCHIDSSQVETGTYLCGPSVLDFSVNGRAWRRTGNRSPHKLAAPHGAYRVQGDDRWIAIACFTEAQWHALVDVLAGAHLGSDPRFVRLGERVRHLDALDDLVTQSTQEWEPYALMHALQARGVPSGVCQSAEDRMDHDPQLAHLQWLVDLPQPTIGLWPVKEIPVHYSETPPYIGGPWVRSGPNYGQDNDLVFGEILGRSVEERRRLKDSGAI